MSVIPVGFAEVTVQFQIPGDAGPAMVVFGTGSNPLDSPEDVAVNVADTLNNTPGFTGLYRADVIAELVTVRLNTGGIAPGVHEETINLPGTLSGATAPPQVASLLQKSTGLAGRPFRGRMYIPGIAEAIVDEAGRITSPSLGIMQTAATAFLDDLGTNNVPMYILHESAAIAPTEVTALNLSPKVATQRRRLR